MKRHDILDPEAYRHLVVKETFASSQEIERARPESFLYQAGYLTIEKWEEQSLTLDYPNREVLDSIAGMYLEHVYNVERYDSIGSDLWRALSGGDVARGVQLYNTALASIPYHDLARRDESLYRSLFLMLLRGRASRPTGRSRPIGGEATSWSSFPTASSYWSSSWHGARERSRDCGPRGSGRSRRRATRSPSTRTSVPLPQLSSSLMQQNVKRHCSIEVFWTQEGPQHSLGAPLVRT